MKILVTGANGQLGYDCVKRLHEIGFTEVLGIDIADLDITDETAVIRYITAYNPDAVIHCAAWTAVDKAEELPEEVYKVNTLGAKYIAEACQRCNAKMIYISTDYVFDGNGTEAFEINDAKNGLSVYGKTKSLGEDYVMSILNKYFIVRISWVFGIHGNNFVRTMLKLAHAGKKELNVVCDQIGSVTYTPDLAVLLCEMIQTDKYGIYHATNEGILSWYDFACEIFRQEKLDIQVNPVTTEEYARLVSNQAKRPLNSRLSKRSLIENQFNVLPDWKNALTRFLKEMKENG